MHGLWDTPRSVVAAVGTTAAGATLNRHLSASPTLPN
jgi:hypothetical protein